MTADAKQLFESSVDQVRQGQVRQALATLLKALAVDPLHHDSLEAAARICRVLGSNEDGDLFEAVLAAPDDAEALFALGHQLVGQDQAQAGAGLLLAALKRLPEGPEAAVVRRELAYARYLQRDFGGCLQTLAPLDDEPSLSETERLDVLLLKVEAALYAGRLPVARALLDEADGMLPDDRQRHQLDALAHLLGRAGRWSGGLSRLGLREWHHIQHGGVLLKTAGGYFEDGSLGGRFEVLELRADMIAFLLQRLVDLFEAHDLRPEAVLPASELAAPLAHALGRVWEVPVLADLAEQDGRTTLVVASGAGELQPLAGRLALHRADLLVAALSLDWSRDELICPEVVGVLARRVFLPWETRYSADPGGGPMKALPGDQRPAAQLGAELATAMTQLPDDGGEAKAEFLGAYAPLADELVLGHPEQHPLRRGFSRVSPAWTPTGKVFGRPDGDDGGDGA